MPIKRIQPNSWGYRTGNVEATRQVAAFGTSITPGQNTYGSYTSILAGASIVYNCYEMWININSVATSNNGKDCIVTIGVDAAGGTSYTTLIPDLLASCASPFLDANSVGGNGGVWYHFPVVVKAGSQLAAKASVNNASVGTVRVAIWMFGAPSRPESIFWGTSVEAIGITAASSSGTAVTSGTTSDGAWTSLGTSTQRCFFWQFGFGINDTTMNFLLYLAELSTGDGTNQIPIIPDTQICTTNVEQVSIGLQACGFCDVKAGATLYGRLQCHGTADASLSMAAYGVRV